MRCKGEKKERTHALLSASSAARWLACPPSARLCELQCHGEEEPSVFAQEGTEAHTLAESKVLGIIGEDHACPSLSFYGPEMEEATEGYYDFVRELFEDLREEDASARLYTEVRLDLTEWIPDGFGYADCVLLGKQHLCVIDFKYGKGIAVSAFPNPQLLCYALGAYGTFQEVFENLTCIDLCIYQPRLRNVSTHRIALQDLLAWGENTLRPRALQAFEGEGEFCEGDHCRYCRVKGSCRKRYEGAQSLIAMSGTLPPLLSNQELSEALSMAERTLVWCKDVKAYALEKALEGEKIEGFTLCHGKSTRRYKDEETIARIVRENGFDPYEKKLLGIGAMTKLLGKSTFQDLLGDYIERPMGTPKLVPCKEDE